MDIVYFGTPAIAAEVLSYLIESGIQVKCVVTAPDRPKGRSGKPAPTPVKDVALQYGLPVHQPLKASSLDSEEFLKNFPAPLFVVVAYGQILRDNILLMPELGCINLHASLLPKYRGAAPIQRCIIQGETESGVSIMYLAREMDAGDVILSVPIPIPEQMDAGELEKEMGEVGKVALLEAIRSIESGKVKRIPQDYSQATFAKKLELEDGEIDWLGESMKIHNQVRGMTPRPGAWCYVYLRGEKKRLKIIKTRIIDRSSQNQTPALIFGKDGMLVSCGKGTLEILKLQLEGKQVIDAESFMRGFSAETIQLNL